MISSVRAAESALNIDVPVNVQYIRNIILAVYATHDHIVYFYQLSALDWVDIISALKVDPAKASAMLDGVSSWHLNSAQEFTKVHNKIKDLVASVSWSFSSMATGDIRQCSHRHRST